MVGRIDAIEIRHNPQNRSFYFSNNQLEMLLFIAENSVHNGDKKSAKYKKEKAKMSRAHMYLINAEDMLKKSAELNSIIYSSCSSSAITNEVSIETKRMRNTAMKKIKEANKIIEKNRLSYRTLLNASYIPPFLEGKVKGEKYKYVVENSKLSSSISIFDACSAIGISLDDAKKLAEATYHNYYQKAPRNKEKDSEIKSKEVEKINELLELPISENQKSELTKALNGYMELAKLQNELEECKRANEILNSDYYYSAANYVAKISENISKYEEKLQKKITLYSHKVKMKYSPVIEDVIKNNFIKEKKQRLDELNKKLSELNISGQSLKKVKSNIEKNIQINKNKLDDINLQEELSRVYHESHKETTTYHSGTGDEVTFENEYGPYYEYKYDGTEDKKEPRNNLQEANESLETVEENMSELNELVTELEVEKRFIEKELEKAKEEYKKSTFLEKLKKKVQKNKDNQQNSMKM